MSHCRKIQNKSFFSALCQQLVGNVLHDRLMLVFISKLACDHEALRAFNERASKMKREIFFVAKRQARQSNELICYNYKSELDESCKV